MEPSADPPVAESVADGVTRPLDPRVIPLDRLAGYILTASLSAILALATLVTWIAADSWWVPTALTVAWPLLTAGLLWLSYAWPGIDYRYHTYCVDERGIEIRHGVFWRSVENVPRSRVQHIDVSQGPIERSYGIGRLVIFTAGTHHSRVELPGLDHAVAFGLRNHLLPRGSDDAI
jgi:membrane protein YdbS with pleckstrin-like domain